MSIREDAQAGKITDLFKACAVRENINVNTLVAGVADGIVAILKNRHHDFDKIMAVGKGTRTKVNANIGSPHALARLDSALEKLEVLVQAGADTVMDLHMGGDLDEVRRGLLEHCPVPLGTVPLYQAVAETVDQGQKDFAQLSEEHIFKTIEKQAIDGVDFMTIHCGMTRNLQERLQEQKRIMGVASRGGSFLLEWMSYHGKENPLYEHFDDLLAIFKEHDVTLSLGDGLRPGCLSDAGRRDQVQELMHLGELTQRAWAAGVQVIIEGSGHMAMDQIGAEVLLRKQMGRGAPLSVAGPLVTDIATGYDRIAGAIGGAIAAAAGADSLCSVSPSEHLKLPGAEDIHETVIASKVAAHAADLVKGVPGAGELDDEMARRRNNLDWKGQIEISLDPEKAARFREEEAGQ